MSISLPFESGLGQEACFDQEDSSKCDASRDLNSIWTTGIALPPQRENGNHYVRKLELPSWRMRATRKERPAPR